MKLLAVALLAAAATPAMKSVDVSLPDDETQFTGPDADLLNANCTGCHSPAMVLYQARMDAATWAESVKKMRDTYKAPIDDADAARLPAALAAVQAQ
ncbi:MULTISPECIES: cytochrome c [Sphingomonas]|uniref:cytochrome c n=1 Tax=Sphingomonas TaxID=13687 RepID=UPI0015ECAF16|nr:MULTISPECIES: cytochrome c [Sphingomonas]MBA2919815.1 cytochrome c [Sphingomonas sp. CGMCC 1.13658]